MKTSSNPNYILSSNLIFISVAFGIPILLLSPGIVFNATAIVSGVISVLFVVALCILARFEISWVKYVLLVSTLLGSFISLPLLFATLQEDTTKGMLSLTQYIMQ